MLFAVEGGGFFSSSASGYSKGLTLLLLGQKKEEKPMSVTPWNQYQLVEQETDSDLQLASGKEQLVRRCASFVCFGRPETGLESTSPLKVAPDQNQEVLPEPPVFDVTKDITNSAGCVVVDDADDCKKKVTSPKSSLKKVVSTAPVAAAGGQNSDEREALCEKNNDVSCQMGRRKVQWTDTIGEELFEIREFEMRRPVAPSPVKPVPPSPPPPSSPPAASPPPKPAAVAADKNLITLEFQRQKAKELQEYFKKKKLEEADQGPFFGFIGKNEISNGRWAMFGFAVGMLTEYATGSDFVDQVKILLSNFGIVDLD
ncbi:hypothetical protein BUALT_Bualt01G0018700 [Buddleja alternifolia]|uniref:Light-harvesting complex-like protein OHP2, chloroplastic n=1 Tax=Buddleja alternifolia TaxID=168488 RepID=A0AAV6Y7V6_9LAMI|nr:hypothetical protein BUALT_Bualt01G0018700 [Buddleja alternifolia]